MEPNEFEKMWYEGVERRLSLIFDKYEKGAAHCETVCAERFASKDEVASMAEDLKAVTKKSIQAGAVIVALLEIVTILAILLGPMIAKHI